jgi:hypothetical protein
LDKNSFESTRVDGDKTYPIAHSFWLKLALCPSIFYEFPDCVIKLYDAIS